MSQSSSMFHHAGHGEASTSKMAMENLSTLQRVEVKTENHPLFKNDNGNALSTLKDESLEATNIMADSGIKMVGIDSGANSDLIQDRRVEGKKRFNSTPENDERIAELQAWLDSIRPDTTTENDQSNTTTDARRVRRNMLVATWNGFSNLAKARRWILALRTLIGLAQLVVGIVILSLPSSLGDSYSTPEICNPEGMFVYLTLHTTRIFFSIPIEFYLGLSPHRTSRSRREGAEGQAERERSRPIGNLALDRKFSRISDLLGLCHVVLFIVGNYIVWTSVECSHYPADSRPLWIACVSMLSISYLIIVEVAAMIFLLVFFLPLLIGLLHILGLSNRLPQRAIHPETGKISQGVIEEHTRLVYFRPAQESDKSRSSCEELERLDGSLPIGDYIEHEAAMIPLPLSRGTSIISNNTRISSSSSSTTSTPVAQSANNSRKKRYSLLFGFQKKRKKEIESDKRKQSAPSTQYEEKINEPRAKTKYPLFPIPSHRASCPICLCDFEELPSEQNDGISKEATPLEIDNRIGQDGIESIYNEQSSFEEVEPLRLLQCGHVMHMNCVDQWLTTVSGRCPVCQRPLLPSVEVSAS